MKFLIYEMYTQNPKPNNEIYILNDGKFLAIFIDRLPKSTIDRITKINELRKNYKLKFIEITQNQFLNYIKTKEILIKNISFIEEIDNEDRIEIDEYIRRKKYFELFEKLKRDNYYYYISTLQIKLIKEELLITFTKNLEIEIEDNSFNQYSVENIFKILTEKKIITDLIYQGDKL